MTTAYFNLASANYFQDWSNAGQLTTSDDWSGVPSIVGYLGAGLTGLTGANPTTITGTSDVIDVNVNQTNPNTFSTGGVTEFAIADPTIALTGSGTADVPYFVLHLDATGRQDLHLSLDVRDIDGSADDTNQQFNIQYRVGDSGTWVNLDGAYIADASAPGATLVTHLDLTLPEALNGQGQIQLRFMTTNAPANANTGVAYTGDCPRNRAQRRCNHRGSSSTTAVVALRSLGLIFTGESHRSYNTPMSTTSKPRRRWFQFRLRTLLVLMFLFCLVVGGLVVPPMQRARKQRTVADAIERLGGSVTWSSGNRARQALGSVWLRRLLGYDDSAQKASFVFSKYPMEHLAVESRGPAWLRKLPGYDLFAQPTSVVIYNNAAIEYLAELPHILKLQLGGGWSDKTDLEYLDEMSRTEETFCQDMHFPSDVMSKLNKPSRRQIPSVDNTPVTGTELKHIQGLTRLQSLDLRGAQVNDAELEHLKNMRQLESLDLKGAQVTDIGLQILQNLAALEMLSLESTQMTDTGVQYLKGMSQLRLLDLSRTQVTDAGVEQLAGLTQLEVLLLTGTQVSDSSVKKLRKILPNCIIRH